MKKAILLASLFNVALLFLSGCASLSKDWDNTTTQDNTMAYETFLRKHPESKYASKAKARIEELDWKHAQASSTISSFREFLRKHPESQYASKAKARVSSYTKDAWEKAHKEDNINAYESFIRNYPESEYVNKAKERAHWHRANRAIVQIDYPKTVTANGRYWWNTVFKETGGKAGFKLRATNFYIRDPSGGRWSNSWSESVDVKANGKATVDYWCDKSNKWAGGYYYTTWIGEDDWGNRISIQQKVHLAK